MILIGGAAQNLAVSTIAGQVFDIPVVVPEPGEYVAGGAAVQAGWALTGDRLAWDIAATASADVRFEPVIRRQYAEVSAQ